MTIGVKRVLKVVLPLALGVLLLWLLYRDMDFEVLLHTLRSGVNYWVILVSCLCGTLGNQLRGERWHLLNSSLPQGHAVLRHNSILAVHGNYTVNMAFPRLGEVWRCAAMSHYTKELSFPNFFGTLLVDRASDFVVTILLIIVAMFMNLQFFVNFFAENPSSLASAQQLLTNPLFYAVLLGVILLIIIVWHWLRHKPFGIKLRSNLHHMATGLKTIGQKSVRGKFFLLTLLIWFFYFLQFYLTFYAFSFTNQLTVGMGLLTFLMAAIGVAAPVQAGMGAWHFMVIYCLVVFGVEQNQAASFALIVHTLQTLWTTLVGLIAIALLPLLNRHTPLYNKA